MQLDQLQLDLRPRTNAQALDLGFALLRANALRVYAVWLSLWLPTIALCCILVFKMPMWGAWGGGSWLLLAWLVRPYLERAPLYMLSRQVFGEQVSWQETLRAWPGQLGGGFVRLILLRPFAAGRGLYQAIWQLEGARKKSARYRIRVIGKHTIGSASWFGAACAHFEGIIQIGFFGLLGLFLSDADAMNPFTLFFTASEEHTNLILICSVIAFTLGGAIIGPIYVACCFTLYLNRRATLEAWDLEIALRQLPHVVEKKTNPSVLAAIFVLILSGTQLWPAPAYAQGDPKAIVNKPVCNKEKLVFENTTQRTATQDADLQKTRQQVDAIYRGDDFQFYECRENWVPKFDKKSKENSKLDPDAAETIKNIALALKYLFIGVGIALVIWLISRYRGQIFGFIGPEKIRFATEVGGLDIRPETLPDDVSASALELWQRGERRAAIGLLYRASLARLVEHHQLQINQGATENDCLDRARQALADAQFGSEVFKVLEMCTTVWLQAAYAKQFPDSISELCVRWKNTFDLGANGGAV